MTTQNVFDQHLGRTVNTNTNSYNIYGYNQYNNEAQDEEQFREDFREQDQVQDICKKEEEQEEVEVESEIKVNTQHQHTPDHGIHSIHPHLHHGVSSKDLEIFEDKNAHIEELNDEVNNDEVVEVEAEVVNENVQENEDDEVPAFNKGNDDDEDKEKRPYENYIG